MISEAVYSELAPRFLSHNALAQFLTDTGVRLEPSGADALYLAGRQWREYLERRPQLMVCPACGSAQDARCGSCGNRLAPRQHVIADFMIGAHAVVHADRLLTRDLGYFRTYFPNLKMV